MRSISILAVLLFATNLGVFSAPIPLGEGDIVTYRRPTDDGSRGMPHPAVVVGPETDGRHDILELSHKLPQDKYHHQLPTGQVGLNDVLPGGTISMTPIRVDASKLKHKGDTVPKDVYSGLKAQMEECKSGQCVHSKPLEVKEPLPVQPQPDKPKAPAVVQHQPQPQQHIPQIPVQHHQPIPQIPVQHHQPIPQNPVQQPAVKSWANVVAKPPGPVVKVAAPPVKPPAQVAKPAKPQAQGRKGAALQGNKNAGKKEDS